MTDAGPFDLIVRKTLVAVWFESYEIVHGGAACLYEACPHSIDMADLLEAVSRVSPAQQEADPAPSLHN